MYGIHGFSAGQLRRFGWLVFFGCLAPFQVAFSADNYRRVESGNTVMFLKNTPEVLARPKFLINMGELVAESSVAAGKGVPAGVVVTGGVEKAAMAKAAARFLGKALPGIATVLAIKDLVRELGQGYSAEQNADGSMIYNKDTTMTMYGATCGSPAKLFTGGADSVAGQCAGYANETQFGCPGSLTTTPITTNGTLVGYRYGGCAAANGNSLGWAPGYPKIVGGPTVPVTPEQLANAVAAKSGWPTDSKLLPIMDEIAKTEPLSLEPSKVTGPASTPAVKTTSTAPDGKVTTNTTTNNYNYGPNTVTVTSTTVSNVFNPTTNTTTVNGTSTVEPELEPEKTPACEENPKALGCAELDTPEGEIPRSKKDVSYEAESYFGGGSCPANKVMNIKGRSVTVFDWASSCPYISGYFRPMLLAVCAFVALMILAPGVKT